MTVEELARIIWEEDGPRYRGWPVIGQRVDWCYSDQCPGERARCFGLASLILNKIANEQLRRGSEP